MSRRILAFGTTGIEKRAVLRKFAQWASEHTGSRYRVLDFEESVLFNETRMRRTAHQILNAPQNEQREAWKRAWALFMEDLLAEEKAYNDHDILVSVHGCWVRNHYGARCVGQLSDLMALKPYRVVTLIDNVFDMWWRTHDRERKTPAKKGKPTLEQLITARRFETVIADMVAYGDGSKPVENLVLAVRHPFESLWHWFHAERPKVVYLCFPISAPRRLLDAGDATGITEIDSFIRLSYESLRNSGDIVLLCPLTIDELPLRDSLPLPPANQDQSEEVEENPVQFEKEKRCWNLDHLFEKERSLAADPIPIENRDPFPARELRDAAGMITTDVGWRDFRLVDQAKYLAVFNPIFRRADDKPPEISRSVNAEMMHAQCDVYVYQDNKHDSGNAWQVRFPSEGTMPHGPKIDSIRRLSEPREIFDLIAKA